MPPARSGAASFWTAWTGAIDFGNQVGNFGTNDFTIDFWLQTQSMRQEAILSMRDCCCLRQFLEYIRQWRLHSI